MRMSETCFPLMWYVSIICGTDTEVEELWSSLGVVVLPDLETEFGGQLGEEGEGESCSS